jgi:PIN domain nuclease of toxin-antitoxin system
VIILDSYAVLALLSDEPASEQVERLITGGEIVRLTALGIAEIVDHLVRITGADEDEAALDLAQLGLASAPAVEATLALQAGLLRAKHYHRVDRAVSLADCVAAETARSSGSSLATADPQLLDLCHAEAISTIPLPNSQGRIWSP